jgi:hypothetical protein
MPGHSRGHTCIQCSADALLRTQLEPDGNPGSEDQAQRGESAEERVEL